MGVLVSRRRRVTRIMGQAAVLPTAPSIVGGSLATGNQGSPITGYTISDSSHKLVVVVGIDSGDSITGASWNGNAMTAASDLATTGSAAIRIFYLDNPTPATGDVAATHNGSQLNYGAFLLIGAADGVAAQDAENGGTPTVNSSITVPGSSHFVVSAYSSQGANDLNPTGTAVKLTVISQGSGGSGSAAGIATETSNAASLAYGWGAVGTNTIAAAAFGPG